MVESSSGCEILVEIWSSSSCAERSDGRYAVRNKDDHYADYDEDVFEREWPRDSGLRSASRSAQGRASCTTPNDDDSS